MWVSVSLSRLQEAVLQSEVDVLSMNALLSPQASCLSLLPANIYLLVLEERTIGLVCSGPPLKREAFFPSFSRVPLFLVPEETNQLPGGHRGGTSADAAFVSQVLTTSSSCCPGLTGW